MKLSGKRALHLVSVVAAAWLLLSCSGGNGGGESDVQFRQGDGQVGEDATTLPDGRVVPNDKCTTSEECPADLPLCDHNSGQCVECKKNSDCTDPDLPFCNPAKMACVQCVMKEHCPSDYQYCLDGACSDKPCNPGSMLCVGNSVHVCSPDGMDPNYEVVECGTKSCFKGQCLECKPGEKACKDKNVIQCSPDGKDYVVLEQCIGATDCFGGQCLVCYPGSKQCEGNTSMRCQNDGMGWEYNEDCSAGGLTCYMGACLSPCAGDIKQNTNAGCEFYAVDLDNAQEGEYDAQNAQYAVIVSNTSKDGNADVVLTQPDGQELKATIGPMSLHKYELPPKWGLDGTLKGMNAYKVTSSRPIVVYQFNPLSNEVEVFSNDASVLLPSPALGNEYFAMTFKQYENTFRGYFTVIGVSSVPTQVTFTPTCKTLAGGDIPSISAGQSHTVELKQGEVLNVESDQLNGDLTGTYIQSNAPVVVYAGHEATNTAGLCCADHLEQQMMPIKTWGVHYLISKTWERWKEKDHVRILASQDGTQVTLNPGVAMVPTLNRGEHFTFQTNVNVEISATKPVLVAQYLASSYEILGSPNAFNCFSASDCPAPFTCDPFYGQCVGPDCSSDAQCPSGCTCDVYMGMGSCAPIGDPGMMLAVPKEQFMESYVFLTPDAYVQDYLNVIAPLNAGKVVLDNNQIPPGNFVPVGASGFGVFRTKLNDGVHNIWSDAKIGIIVYGYDDDVSYGYPGGMGLLELNF